MRKVRSVELERVLRRADWGNKGDGGVAVAQRDGIDGMLINVVTTI